MKKYLITMLSTLTVTIGILFSFDLINENKDNELKKLENKIVNLKAEIAQYQNDKIFYKNLYVSMAQEYENRLHELGIEEYILTDTSR